MEFLLYEMYLLDFHLKKMARMARLEEKKQPIHLGFLTTIGNTIQGVIGGFLVLNLAGRPVEFHCTAPARPNRAQEILYGNTLEGFICGEQIAPALVNRSKVELGAILTNIPCMLTGAELLTVPMGLVLERLESVQSDPEKYVYLEEQKKKDFVFSQIHQKVDDTSDMEKEVEETTVNGQGNSFLSLSDKSQLDEISSANNLVFYNSLDSIPFIPGLDFELWQETTIGKNHFAFSKASSDNASFENIVAKIEPFLKAIDSIEPFERIRLALAEARKAT